MASSTKIQAPRSHMREPIVYNEMAIRGNMGIINYSRTFMSAVSGSTAGILGLTGLYGFVFYFITALFLSLMLFLKAGRNWSRYFTTKKPILTQGLFGGLFTYILFWTFLYGMVHVY